MTHADPLPYAVPAPRPGARAGDGAAILFAGLGLICLGGCFLIGVMSMVSPQSFNPIAPAPGPFTVAQWLLMAVLYLLAFAHFAGAVLLYVGTRALLRVMNA